ncbi:prepilin-type N-terminal cleavage/methylation domain-containing protein [Providencia rettgeri]|uniref:prepilin-type N-terminal cleavage/methylation domain-containing protein n=1 Tax=Providencia rettgeri TaxID=587 RepID=UPI0034E080C4
MKKSQQGFALVESMVATVVFAILLIALLNYTQYIVLNFNQLYKGSMAIRELHSVLENQSASAGEMSRVEIPFIDADLRYSDGKIEQSDRNPTEFCTELMVSLLIPRQRLSLSRWYCSIGEHHVSSLSF